LGISAALGRELGVVLCAIQPYSSSQFKKSFGLLLCALTAIRIFGQS
jgi:hypothetical protein